MTTTDPSTPPGAPEPARARVRISFPGDWVTIDTRMVQRWKQDAGEVRPELKGALSLLDRAAEVFAAEGVIVSAVLLQRGSPDALATMACFNVGMPELPGSIDLAAHVRSNPPHDAVEDTFEVDEDEAAGGKLRARCLRHVVLEVPSRDTVSLAVEYFVPARDAMLVASFTTPHVAKEAEYLTLFSSIAASIAVD